MRNAGRTHGELFSKVPKLGPALTSSSPTPRKGHGPPLELDVETDQNLNSKYVFSGTQRELIKTGDVNDRSKRNKSVLKKRDLLPDRIQDLVEDIALLHNTAYLSNDHWESGKVEGKQTQSAWADFHRQLRSVDEGTNPEDISPEEREVEQYESPFDGTSDLWKELISIDQRGQQVRDDVFFHGASVALRETQFGYEIGSLLRILRPERDENVPGADLIWGFLLAFIGQSRDTLDQERELLDELTTIMHDNHDSRRNDAESTPNVFVDPAKEVTAEGIKEAGFRPHSILIQEVLHHQPVLENDTYYKNAVKQLVSKIDDTVPLQQIDQLYTQLTQDLSTLESRSVPGIESAQRIIEAHMVQNLKDPSERALCGDNAGEQGSESGPNDEEIGASFKKEGNTVPELTTKKTVTIGKVIDIEESVIATILNRLSDEENSELWTTQPVFDKRSDGWRPTPYGRLLAHVSCRRKGDTDLLYWFALGPEEITLYERKLIIEALNAENKISLSPVD